MPDFTYDVFGDPGWDNAGTVSIPVIVGDLVDPTQKPFQSGFGSPASELVGTLEPDQRINFPGLGSGGTKRWPTGILAFVSGSLTDFPDDGGERVTLIGNWPTSGPYRVFLRRLAVLYPAGGCLSTLVDGGTECYASRLKLSFTLPQVDIGTYDIVLQYGPNYTLTEEINGAINITVRPRCPFTHRMRSSLPGIYKTGPRRLVDELVVTGVES